jgi:hypothetical protein
MGSPPMTVQFSELTEILGLEKITAVFKEAAPNELWFTEPTFPGMLDLASLSTKILVVIIEPSNVLI